MSTSKMTVVRGDREITFSREFHAPRTLVFRMFRQPEHLAKWWGPNGWKLPVCEIDFRPGGVWRYCLEGPGGERVWVKAIYHEITEPELIVYADGFVDAEGRPQEGLPHGMTRVTFQIQGQGTLLTSRVTYLRPEDVQSVAALGMIEGVTESWNLLEGLLASLSQHS